VSLFEKAKKAIKAIKKGANINLQRDPDGNTPLMIACSEINDLIVAPLLDNHANITIQNKKQKTALDYVLEYNYDNPLREEAEWSITRLCYFYLLYLVEIEYPLDEKMRRGITRFGAKLSGDKEAIKNRIKEKITKKVKEIADDIDKIVDRERDPNKNEQMQKNGRKELEKKMGRTLKKLLQGGIYSENPNQKEDTLAEKVARLFLFQRETQAEGNRKK